MNKLGRIFKHNDRLIIDAEPHVMARIRSLFTNGWGYGAQGLFTHKPISLPNTLNVCRDLLWISERYPMDFQDDILTTVKDKATEYDRILAEVSNADKDTKLNQTEGALRLGVELREHQIGFLNMARKMKKMLNADKMGLGKTICGLSLLAEPETRPAIIVVPPTLCTQWEREVKRVLPDASVHVIRGFKNYDLPDVDVLITSYNRLKPWEDKILDQKKLFKTVIFDEVHELRHTTTDKRKYSKILANKTEYTIGLSGTPIFNYGSEIWSVLDVVKDGCLGDEDDFKSEWCSWEKVTEPAILHSYLKNLGLMIRRTPEQVGLGFGQPSKHIYTIDSDLESLKEVKDIAKTLALSVLSGRVGEDSESSREFDWKLRQATGVAKAKSVAEFVRMICENGEKVVLGGWHRSVWDILNKELKDLKPVMFTGSESVREKEEALKSFIDGDSQIFMISLRSGAGIDGLQKVCSTVVIGELDWSGAVLDQLVMRIDRDGQTRHVQAYYLTVADGSDPFIMETLNIKRSQHDGLIEGKEGEGVVLEGGSAGNDRIKEMAKHYLQSIGEEIPVTVSETGLLRETADALRKMRIPNNNEAEMQDAIWKMLPSMVSGKTEKEFKISSRSRLDFLVSNETEKVAIECKITDLKRADVYRQVRRYIEEGCTSVIVVAPWHGIPSFVLDGVSVVVVDTSLTAI